MSREAPETTDLLDIMKISMSLSLGEIVALQVALTAGWWLVKKEEKEQVKKVMARLEAKLKREGLPDNIAKRITNVR